MEDELSKEERENLEKILSKRKSYQWQNTKFFDGSMFLLIFIIIVAIFGVAALILCW